MKNRTPNPMKRPARAAAAAVCAAAILAAATLLSGCATDSTTLARVGGETITVGDYKLAAGNAGGRYNGTPDSARAQLMDDLVRRALMLHYAHASGMLVDTLVARAREKTENAALVNALSASLVPNSVPVSDAEVRAMHALRDSSSHCQVIYTTDRRMATAARAALDNGEPFSITADRFNPRGMVPRGGDLGYILPGSLMDPLDTIVRKAPVGEIIGPFEAPGEGWFVLRVVARRAEAPVEFAKARPQLTQMLMQRKRRALSVAALQGLREAYHVVVVPDAEHVLRPYVVPQGMNLDQPPPNPSPEARAQVLATWDGGPGFKGAYTLGDAVEELDSGIRERPDPSMLSTFRPWIESRVVQRVAEVEGRRRRLLEEPDIAREVRDRMDNYVLQAVYNDAVMLRVEPSEEDYRTAWERFDQPDKGPFESMSDTLREHLQSAAFQIASERRLIAFTDSLKQSVPVHINASLLHKLPRPSGVLFRG